MNTTRGREDATRRRRWRWGSVAIAAAVMTLSGCTLDFSDGKIQVMCWPDDYDVRIDFGGDYHYTSNTIGCADLGASKYGPGFIDWPIEGVVLWPAT